MSHPTYIDKLEALVWALAHGVSALQVGYEAPWKAREDDESPHHWSIEDAAGLHVMEACDHEYEEGQLAKSLTEEICANVNLSDELVTALMQSSGGLTVSEDTVTAAYEALPPSHKKWRK